MKNVGDQVSYLIKGFTQDQINLFGKVHGTDGKTHTDPDYAKNSQFKGVIVQGTLVFAPVVEILMSIFGHEKWQRSGVVETKFSSFVRPLEDLTVSFVVQEVTDRCVSVSYEVRNEKNTVVQLGTASA